MPPRRDWAADDGRSDEVVRGLVQAGLDAATSEAFTGVLVDVAVTLSEEASAREKPGHWLCVMLADAADGLDPASVAGVIGNVFADALVDVGVPEWAASIAGWGIANGARQMLTHILPGAQLCLGLRVLGMLVCPAPEPCPAGDRLSAPLLKAALAQNTSN